jgi:uncharacterized membrane protein
MKVRWGGHGTGKRAALLCGVLMAVLTLALPVGLWAGEPAAKDNRPERGIAVYSEFSGVVVPVGESVRMELTVENKGKRDEIVQMNLAAIPKGWRASLKGGAFTVTGVAVPDGKTRTLSFSAEPDKGVGPGTYDFVIEGVTEDKQLKSTYTISVASRERSRMGASEDILVTTSYPVLRGQTDATFEFSLDVNNKTDADRTFNLAAQAPEKWEVNFKPGYEQKQISSIRVKGNSNQTVAVSVTPPKDAQSGEYPVLVRISSGDSKAEVKLMVVLTGIYKLEAATATGILSTDAVVGQPTTVSLMLKNTGSAVQRTVNLNSFKPENWKVEFKPEKLENVEPNQLKQVEAKITPAAGALVGDYSVGLMVDGERGSSKTVEMRVTVRAPTAWGWIGVGLIALVIAGMGGLFAWLGRR